MNTQLTLVENEIKHESNFEMLLPIEPLENGMRAVNARKLHDVLGSLQHYTDWIKNRIKKYGFKETSDFVREHKIMKRENTNLLNTRTEYWLTVEMAKELAMLESSEMGTKVRRYFIEVEKNVSEIVQYEGGKEIDVQEVVSQIVASMGDRFMPKDAHDRILELELKVQRLQHEAEITRLIAGGTIAQPERQNTTVNVEKPTVEKTETLNVARGGQVEAFPEAVDGMTVSKAIKRLVADKGIKKAEVMQMLETLGFATPGTNGTMRWEYTWAFNGGFGAYDAHKNFKLNDQGYAEILKNM